MSAEENNETKKSKTESHSQIPVLSPTHFKRTGSLKLRNEMRMPHKSEPTSTTTPPLRRHRSLQGLSSPILPRHLIDKSFEKDDDLDSEKSFGSSCNSLCGHSPFAHNGTTYSARHMKYIFHCTSNSGSEEYLTPTQRANRTIKRLRRMLADAQSELIEKDNEISRLTKEVVELRLLKAGNSRSEFSEDLKHDDLEFVEPLINKSSPRFMDVLIEEHDSVSANKQELIDQSSSKTNPPMDNPGVSVQIAHHSPSLADSGNFEDINCTFAQTLEKDLEKLRQNYDDMREKHNEKVEQLLKIIAESNDKYYDLKPKHDTAEIKIKELEKEIESLKNSLMQQEELQKTLYLQLFAKQEKVEQTVAELEKSVEPIEKDSTNASEVTNLMQKLAITKEELDKVKDSEYKNDSLLSAKEAISLWILGTRKAMYRALLENSKRKYTNDSEMTLRFLKSAVFYFLTDTSNSKDHLAAIVSILGYSDDEKTRIEKVQAWKY